MTVMSRKYVALSECSKVNLMLGCAKWRWARQASCSVIPCCHVMKMQSMYWSEVVRQRAVGPPMPSSIKLDAGGRDVVAVIDMVLSKVTGWFYKARSWQLLNPPRAPWRRDKIRHGLAPKSGGRVVSEIIN